MKEDTVVQLHRPGPFSELECGQPVLSCLVQPLDVDEFLTNFWEQRHCHIERRETEKFEKLFALKDVDTLLSHPNWSVRRDQIRLVKSNGGEIASAMIPVLSDNTLDIFEIYRKYHAGYSLILSGVDSCWQPISEFCRDLSFDLGVQIGANLYITPPNTQGFLPHQDTHDVFVIQLHGAKSWSVYHSREFLPLTSSTYRASDHEIGDPEQVITNGGEIASAMIPVLSDNTLDIFEIYRKYHAGYSLILSGVDSCWQPISEFCRDLSFDLGVQIGANLYITPPNTQGFLPHQDTHDVFVIQLHGAKSWSVYHSREFLPLTSSTYRASDHEIGDPEQVINLSKGSVLYLPRGVVHQATTKDESSIHLTIGVYVTRFKDLLVRAIEHVAEKDIRLRKALPLKQLDRMVCETEISERLSILLAAVSNTVDWDSVIQDYLKRRRRAVQPPVDGHFASLERLAEINLNTRLERRRGLVVSLSTDAETVSIKFSNNQVNGPVELEEAFRYIAERESVVVGDLPNSMTANSKVVLARRLVREGLFAIV